MADEQSFYKDPLISQQPESDKNEAQSMMHILRKAFMSMCDVCIPAVVVSYDRAKNRAVVRGLIQRVTVDNKIARRQPLYDIPLFAYGDGNFHISFPVKAGTLGWILVCDRDIELYKSSLKESRPNTYRAHTFADSWFIPDQMHPLTIAGEDSEAMVIQHASSNSRVSVAADAVRITVGDTKITVIDGKVTVKATAVDLDAQTTNVLGALNVTGLTTLSGGLTSTSGGETKLEGSTTIQGREFLQHDHPDAHGGNTGPVN